LTYPFQGQYGDFTGIIVRIEREKLTLRRYKPWTKDDYTIRLEEKEESYIIPYEDFFFGRSVTRECVGWPHEFRLREDGRVFVENCCHGVQ
jgi:hypothetical protein